MFRMHLIMWAVFTSIVCHGDTNFDNLDNLMQPRTLEIAGQSHASHPIPIEAVAESTSLDLVGQQLSAISW